ncbi:Hypothetical predicted protein [Octopus vulgaris]|uniref:Protein Hikeshi n=1 Tax=Octopus vulgaris TaxID=6645 RepID=A0AA36F343_OCTVU|nr:Hypothetical predicted protein [Octopus vulgaris]
MFGVIVAGRFVQTNCEQVTENQFLFNILESENINHIVVFLTGQIPFPDGYGGAAEASLNPFGVMASQPVNVSQIGISVEPLQDLSQQTPATSAAVSNLEPFMDFSKKMVENLFNFASSFASKTPMNPSESYIPFSTLEKWYNNFLRKMEQDPYFWRS